MGEFHPISKPWGYTFRLPMPSGAEVHIAYMKKGGESSFHCHENMVNIFFVVEGEVMIQQEVGPDIILRKKDVLAVETNNHHSFRALTDCIVVEAYGQVDIKRIKVS